jgi:ribosomal protein S18 acetylase RimI-like enzyme
MARLSNFLRRHDDDGDDAAGSGLPPPVCRPARAEEVDAALRLLLAGPGGLANEEQVLEFLAFTNQRAVDVRSVWVAIRTLAGSNVNRVEWALLPVVSPGRTMLLLTPNQLLRQQTPESSVRALCDEVCAQYARQGVQLAQLLLDPNEREVRDVYAASGFHQLAELVYLSRAVKRPLSQDELLLPPGFDLIRYDPASLKIHDHFARTITASYDGSLDCPGLNGMRDIVDVLEGHKAAGEFDPKRWRLLLEYGQPRAVLLTNRSLHADALELVYLGLVPEARGRGLGDWMVKLALACASEAGCAELTLAVDSRNAPALKLYFRHGMQRVATRIAMLRDLRGLIA